MRSSLAPVAPILLAGLALLWREAVLTDTAAASPPPGERAAALAFPGFAARGEGRARLARGSTVRFLAGADVAVVGAQGLRGELDLDQRGLPRRLSLAVDLGFLERGDGARAPGLAMEVIGVHSTTRLRFAGTRQGVAYARVPGVAEVLFLGTVDVGSTTRRAVVDARVVSVEPGRMRVVARTTVLGSSYGLKGLRSLAPFARERPLTVVWDLVLDVASG